jgi:hypothetical protein
MIRQQRNLVATCNRVLQALDNHPELNFTQLARMAGVSRMHLYRLACQYPEIQEAYTAALSYKRIVADMTATDSLLGAAFGSGGYNYKECYVLSQKVMRYDFYLSCWENSH